MVPRISPVWRNAANAGVVPRNTPSTTRPRRVASTTRPRRVHDAGGSPAFESASRAGVVVLERLGRRVIAATAFAATALLLFGSRDRSGEAAAQECGAWQVEYSVSGNLQLSDTPMGAGNGTYRVGPGRMVLRFAGGSVALLSYEMPERFGIESKRCLDHAREHRRDGESHTRGMRSRPERDHARNDARLVVEARRLSHRRDGRVPGVDVRQVRGAATGTSPLHIGPSSIALQPFEFSRDGKTFTIGIGLRVEDRRASANGPLSLSGREVRRSCAPQQTCR